MKPTPDYLHPFEARTVTIATVSGGREVEGRVYRGLVLHRSLDYGRDGSGPPPWTVSHLPTGHAMFCSPLKFEELKPIVVRMADAVDWESFTDPEGPRRHPFALSTAVYFGREAKAFMTRGRHPRCTCPVLDIVHGVATVVAGEVGVPCPRHPHLQEAKP